MSSHPQKSHVCKILVQSASHRPVRKIDTAHYAWHVATREILTGDHLWSGGLPLAAKLGPGGPSVVRGD